MGCIADGQNRIFDRHGRQRTAISSRSEGIPTEFITALLSKGNIGLFLTTLIESNETTNYFICNGCFFMPSGS
jgi:hypothetical protein